MGLVIGISVCVGGVYAVKKNRKRRKKKKAKKLAQQELEDAAEMDHSGDEGEDSGCGSDGAVESATADVHHAEVISERGYTGSVRKRNHQAWPDDSGYSFAKVKPPKSSHGMSKLEEESDDHIVGHHANSGGNSRGQRDSAGSPKGQRSSKSYKQLDQMDLRESGASDDEYEKSPGSVSRDTARKSEDYGYHSEENYHIAKDMRMSIRVGESGNTIFKIYKTDDSTKKPTSELRSTTWAVTV